jgi:hypothetical protein
MSQLRAEISGRRARLKGKKSMTYDPIAKPACIATFRTADDRSRSDAHDDLVANSLSSSAYFVQATLICVSRVMKASGATCT